MSARSWVARVKVKGYVAVAVKDHENVDVDENVNADEDVDGLLAAVLVAAIGPRHLLQGDEAEIFAAHIASAVAIVAGVDEDAPALDLIEGEAQHLLGAGAWLGGEQLLDLGWALAGEHLGEQGGEHLAALHELAAEVLEIFGGKARGHRGGIAQRVRRREMCNSRL